MLCILRNTFRCALSGALQFLPIIGDTDSLRWACPTQAYFREIFFYIKYSILVCWLGAHFTLAKLILSIIEYRYL